LIKVIKFIPFPVKYAVLVVDDAEVMQYVEIFVQFVEQQKYLPTTYTLQRVSLLLYAEEKYILYIQDCFKVPLQSKICIFHV
jgi:hypothetical protein